MDPIINILFNKYPTAWELIQFCLLHPSGSVTKSVFCHQNLTGLPKQYPKRINTWLQTISDTENKIKFKTDSK